MHRSRALTAASAAALLAVTPATAQESRVPEATTAHFELFNDARVSLHHFLVNWAAAEAGERPPYAPALAERDAGLDHLHESERAVWQAAVGKYARAVGRSYVFDVGLAAVREAAAGIGTRESVPSEDRILLEALESAIGVYEARWWPAHRALNGEWIEAVAPTLREVEAGIATRLAGAFGGQWPAEPIRVDVVAYANPVGAYSTGGIVTIASGDEDNRMPQAIEMLFHESSHIDPLEVPLRELVAAAYEAEGTTAPDRLWHDFIFFTSGEATRLALAAAGQPAYEHYGSLGVYRRNERWPPQLEAFEAHWRPFLESGSPDPGARMQAARAVARDLAE